MKNHLFLKVMSGCITEFLDQFSYKKIIHPKRRTAILSLLLLFNCTAYAQVNYVRTRVPRTKISTSARLDQLSTTRDSVETTTQYIDGLGRPVQTVMQYGSPTGKDLVQPVAYDQFGREAIKYLPYAMITSTTGNYKANALDPTNGVTAFYASGSGTQQVNGMVRTTKPFAETVFEASPLNRVVEQSAPGTDWQIGQGHTVKMTYATNGQQGFSRSILTNNPGSDRVALYSVTINADQSRILSRASSNTANYGSGQLTRTIVMDENRGANDGCLGTTEEYKDKDGRIVVKRTYNKNVVPGANTVLQQLSTYYIYDDLGNLSFVLPPGAKPDTTAAISQATLNALCYQYRYDERNRLVAKKLPGKTWEYLVYNKRDQVVATQDSSLRNAQQWMVTKYDALGRVILTGIFQKTNFSAAAFRDSVYAHDQWDVRNSSGTGSGYTVNSYPATLTTTYRINYYDNYDNIPNWVTGYAYASGSKMTRGLLTLSKTLIVNTPSTRLLQVNYYDDEGRGIKTFTQHYLGGGQSIYNYDDETTSYNFTDQPTVTTRKHYIKNSDGTAATLTLTASDSLAYDHKGRSRQHWNRLTNGVLTPGTKTLLSQQEYNEVGQLYRKKLHSTNSGSTFYQTVLYQYNERGWLVKDSAQLFTQQISYNTGAVPQYNGNISAQIWQTNGGAVKSANYTYDKLNRLLSGNTNDGFGERAITYDLMGNLKTLSRYQGGVLIDSLNYHYPNGGLSNQADTIRDLSGSGVGAPITAMAYTYSGDGLTKRDGRNGNNIAYNQLDLPQTITGNDNITYYYNAAGIKTAKVSVVGANTTKTDYIGGIQYITSNTGAPVIDLIQTAEGRARPSGSSYVYEYDLTDHLGNARVTFATPGASATLVQNNDYYPFGMVSNEFVSGTKNQYLYNKKELQEELGTYDFGQRQYDPVIGRFNTIDRFAEKYSYMSTYQYGANNPIKNIDINGDSLRISNNGQNYLYQNGKLYQNGAEYTGKVKGFLKDAVNALGKINGGKEGASMLSELEGSKNNFSIVKGDSKFNESNAAKAYANEIQTDPSQAGTLQSLTQAGVSLQGGSGGVISWDPSGAELPTTNGGQTNPVTDLAHEMFHGLDANRGMLNDNMTNGIKGSEWQAVYRENVLRGQLGQPLRTNYIKSVDPSGAYVGGSGVRMITPANQPIVPQGYKP